MVGICGYHAMIQDGFPDCSDYHFEAQRSRSNIPDNDHRHD